MHPWQKKQLEKAAEISKSVESEQNKHNEKMTRTFLGLMNRQLKETKDDIDKRYELKMWPIKMSAIMLSAYLLTLIIKEILGML